MRCLYFQPKSITQISKKCSKFYQKILLMLENCSGKEELMQIHCQMIRTQLVQDNFLVSQVIAVLSQSSSPANMMYAHKLFDQIPQPNLFMWNSLIRGYTHCNHPEDACTVYKLMLFKGVSPDSYTYSVLTRACVQMLSLQLGEMVHGMVMKSGFESDMFVISGFINLYSSFGGIIVARKLFDAMPEKDVVSWTLIIIAYAKSNCWEEAFALLQNMKATGTEPNSVMLTNLLSASGQLHALDRGKWIHSYIAGSKIEHDLSVSNSLISMYGKCGSMMDAVEVFNKMLLKDRVTWNAFIGGLVENGLYGEALRMFQDMTCSNETPDKITIVSALSACSQLSNLQHGKLLNDYIKDHKVAHDLVVNNALINMYVKCGDIKNAEALFLQMPERDVCSWTTMITGYGQSGRIKEALDMFEEMKLFNVVANEVTLVGLLSACGQAGALDHGKRIHSYIDENEVTKDVFLWNSLIDMYSKCGGIEIASQLFHKMPHKDTSSWNIMIGGLAAHGHAREALDLFHLMLKEGDVKPDQVTHVAVLGACTHTGLVHEGLQCFYSMSKCGVSPTVEHYGCMVDLLGRAGLIHDAIDFIKKMPMKPNSVIWGSLLAACHTHKFFELAEEAAEFILGLAPHDEGAHVLMSNLYAESSRWDDVRRLRGLMESKSIQKLPGCSSI